jgi:hypothetical protein
MAHGAYISHENFPQPGPASAALLSMLVADRTCVLLTGPISELQFSGQQWPEIELGMILL